MEAYDAQQDRAHRADARPHGIGCTDGQCLHRHGKQPHAGNEAARKTGSHRRYALPFWPFILPRQKAKAVSNNPATIKIIQFIVTPQRLCHRLSTANLSHPTKRLCHGVDTTKMSHRDCSYMSGCLTFSVKEN